MKNSRRIISFITALAVSSSFVSCKNKEDSSQIIEESQPEVTATEEPSAEPVEIGNEYKLTCYYEEQPVNDAVGLFGTITDTLYGGDHIYYLTDDITYTSGSGYRMCNVDLTTLQRTDIYNAPEGFVYTPANPSDLPEGVTLGANDTLFTIFTDRILYGNEKGVCVKDIKTGAERVIEKAGTTSEEVLGAFFDGKKYIIVYKEKPQTLKHFYSANANGDVTEEAKMTLGFDGSIDKAFVNSAGDLYFTKVERTQKTTVVSADKSIVSDTTKIELYRMKPDGTLNRMVGGETLPYNIEINDLFVSSDGNIFLIETDPVNGKTVQRFDSYGIRTARITLDSSNSSEDDSYFGSGSELWRVYEDSDGSISLCMINDDGEADFTNKISTEMGNVVSKLAGDSVYDAYISDRSSVYGIKTSENKVEELMQWTDADVDASLLTCLGIKDAGDIYCLKNEVVVTEEIPAVTNDAVVTEAVPAADETAEGEEDTDEDTDEDADASDEDEDTDDTESEDEDTEGDDEAEEDEEDDEDEDTDEVTSEDPSAAASETPEPVVKTEIVKRTVRLVKADANRLAEINSKRIITIAGDIYATININGQEYDLLSRIKEFNSASDKFFIHPKNYAKFGETITVSDEELLGQNEEDTDEKKPEDADTEDEDSAVSEDSASDEDEEEAEDESDEDEEDAEDEDDEDEEDEDDEDSETAATPSVKKINGMQKLEQDMREGFTPDLIVYDPADNDFSSYAADGKFTDLRDFMKDDVEISEDDLMENISELCMSGDVMYRIFPVFKGRTFIADESAVDGKSHWKMSEFLESANVSNTIYVNEEDALDAVLPAYLIDHTDFDEKTCTFDKKDFRELLQWADAFPSVDESPSVDYDTMVHKLYSVRADLLSSPNQIAYAEAETGEDAIVKGMPSTDKELGLQVEPGLCFSVLKTSDAKNEAWYFIRQFLTEDFYDWGQDKGYTEEEINGHLKNNVLPVRKSVLDKLIEDCTSFRFERMLNGKDYVPTVYTTWGEEYEIDEIKSSATDKFRKAVNSTAYLDPKGSPYYNAVREEAVKYFTSPDMTAEDASKAVQKAASAFLSSEY
ncbi:MAG: hypothetical protein IJL67_03905 [Oscillospiraceae bacterium]|nr:hypothetical protein [Oscillospiraceae bacterium]